MIGTVDGGRVSLVELHRFVNGAVEREGHLRWDLTRLHSQVLDGLGRAPKLSSVGIDTWGVDYGLLDADGQLLAEPVSYRDDRTAAAHDAVHALVARPDLYAITGVQFLPFNTIYQLVADSSSSLWARAANAVLIPDLLAYWLTGRLRSELTVASTTGLVDIWTRDWSGDLLATIGLPLSLFPPIDTPGQLRGRTKAGVPVVTVGSHDTASAVVATPATTDRFAYISCGTWSLVGVELDAPVINEDARQANFTNEIGVDGRIRFLRNVGGLWLLQECLREWRHARLDELLSTAAHLPAGGPRVPVDDPAFIQPGAMPSRITEAAGARPGSLNQPQIVRCILDSLAYAYAQTIHRASVLSGLPVEVVHIVGGGSSNPLLCQLTATAAQTPVLAGPVEATAIGNVLIQARTAGATPTSLEALRAAVAQSIRLEQYRPQSGPDTSMTARSGWSST